MITLSAINDVNLPKFTSNDLPLFKGITYDLFPGLEVNTPDYARLDGAIATCVKRRMLQNETEFHKSVIQLYETVAVRHGLMVVGDTYSGKTNVIHTLADVLSLLQEENPGDPDYLTTKVWSINPKSITQGQLYGKMDQNAGEWSDGVLAIMYREKAKDPSPTRHWIVFDGPVDAVWIEDMNTVLDNNKKLCLTSGEIMFMSDLMTMMFETEDLEEASPATVSRVGMVFMEPKRLGWEPLLESWFLTLGVVDRKSGLIGRGNESIVTTCEFDFVRRISPYRRFIRSAAKWLLPPLHFFINNCVNTPVPITNQELAANCFRLYKALLQPLFEDGGMLAEISDAAATAREEQEAAGLAEPEFDSQSSPSAADKKKKKSKGLDVESILEGLLVHALVWSTGAVTDSAGRKVFDDLLRKLLSGTIANEAEFILFNAKNPRYRKVNPLVDRAQVGKPYPTDTAGNTCFDYQFTISEKKGVTGWEGERSHSVAVPYCIRTSNIYFARVLVTPLLCSVNLSFSTTSSHDDDASLPF